MITRDKKSNIGYDFDVNIRVNDDDNEYSAKEIRRILKDGFDKHSKKFQYDYAEDSKRVLTIKVKDRKNSKILHSCDFAVANDYTDNQGNYHQKFIYFNKKQNTYEWQEQPEGFYMLDEKIGWIKENDLWQEVRDSYIERKNSNNDPNKNQDLSSQKQLLLFLMTMVAFKMIIMMTTNMMINDEGGKRYV